MKIKFLFPAALTILLFSCFKEDTTPTPPAASSYVNTSSGSTWNYHLVDNSTGSASSADYTITSTARDTSINGKSYHVYDNSLGSHQYNALTGSDYYQYDSLPTGLGAGAVDRLYLKDNLAATGTWTQNLTITVPGSPFPIPFTITNTIAEKGITRTVNGTAYDDVIHVSTVIASVLIPSSSLSTNINSYYAPKYGLIENSNNIHLDYLGIMQDLNTETKLVSATIK